MLIMILKHKNQRIKNVCIVAEVQKVIHEFIEADFTLQHLFTTDISLFPDVRFVHVSEKDLQSISYLTTANTCLAVFSIPKTKLLPDSKLQIALDAIRDPGYLVTINRICN